MPSTAVLELLIDLKGNGESKLKSLAGEVDNVGKHAGLMRTALGTALGIVGGGAVIGAATAGFHALVSGVGSVIQESRDAAQGQAQLAAVLKSTGGAAGVTAKMANDLANNLQHTTRFTDDQVLAGENLLLTFTNIGAKTFPMATRAMVDMAQAMGGDPQANAIQLGKALNDPIQGITALTRSGVSFTAQQKENIKAMVEHGNVAGAQGVILAELNKEFGGSAAAAETAAGGMDVLSHRFDDVKQAIGDALMPALTAAMAFIGSDAVMGTVERLGVALAQGLSGAVTWLTTAGLPLLASVFGTVAGAVSGVWNAVQLLITGDFSGGIFGLNEDDPVILFFFTLRDTVMDVAGRVFPFVRDAFQTFVQAMQGDWVSSTQIQPFHDLIGNLGLVVHEVFDWIKNTGLPGVQTAFQTAWPIAKQAVADFQTYIATVVSPQLRTFVGWLQTTGLPQLSAAFKKSFSDSQRDVANFNMFLGETVVPGVHGSFTSISQDTTKSNQDFATWATGVGERLTTAHADVMNFATAVHEWLVTNVGGTLIAGIPPWDTFTGSIGRALGTLVGTVAAKMQEVVNTIVTLPGKIGATVGQFVAVATSLGNSIINGVITGVNALAGALLRAITNAVQNAISAGQRLLNSWVPHFPTITLPHVPGFATGVQDFRGGLALVGERGPELVSLPARSSIYTAPQTRDILNSGERGPIVGTLIINQQPGEDAEALANRVVGIIDQRSRMRR